MPRAENVQYQSSTGHCTRTIIDRRIDQESTLMAPNYVYATRKMVFTAIAPGIGLTAQPIQVNPAVNGGYTARLHVTRYLAHQKEEEMVFSSISEATKVVAEENVANQALRYYCGEQAIPVLDYTIRCIISAQQHACIAQKTAVAAQQAMDVAQQATITAQQDANQAIREAREAKMLCQEAIQQTGLYKRVLLEMIFKSRKALHNSPNVLPIRIRCPRTPYPNERDNCIFWPSSSAK